MEKLIGNIRGPQGEQGVQGIQGEKGEKGDTGETGKSVLGFRLDEETGDLYVEIED